MKLAMSKVASRRLHVGTFSRRMYMIILDACNNVVATNLKTHQFPFSVCRKIMAKQVDLHILLFHSLSLSPFLLPVPPFHIKGL